MSIIDVPPALGAEIVRDSDGRPIPLTTRLIPWEEHRIGLPPGDPDFEVDFDALCREFPVKP